MLIEIYYLLLFCVVLQRIMNNVLPVYLTIFETINDFVYTAYVDHQISHCQYGEGFIDFFIRF